MVNQDHVFCTQATTVHKKKESLRMEKVSQGRYGPVGILTITMNTERVVNDKLTPEAKAIPVCQ